MVVYKYVYHIIIIIIIIMINLTSSGCSLDLLQQPLALV